MQTDLAVTTSNSAIKSIDSNLIGLVRVQYDAYNRLFELLDKEVKLNDGETYAVVAPINSRCVYDGYNRTFRLLDSYGKPENSLDGEVFLIGSYHQADFQRPAVAEAIQLKSADESLTMEAILK